VSNICTFTIVGVIGDEEIEKVANDSMDILLKVMARQVRKHW